MPAEIYEHDNMVYVGQPPWHGLGVELPPNLSSLEVMDFANLGWEVNLQDIHLYNNVLIEGFQAIERSDTKEIFDIVSDIYRPYQNREAFTVFQKILDTGMVDVHTAGSLKNGRIVWVLGSISGGKGDVAGDAVKRFILFSWGHTSGRSIQLGYTDVRVVCWNTLSAAEDRGALIRVMHKGDVATNVDLVRQSLDISTQTFRANLDLYNAMVDTDINQEDLIRYVELSLDIESGQSTRATNIVDKVLEFAKHGIGNSKFAGKLWAGFNGITQWVSHEAGRNANNRVTSMWWGKGKQIISKATDLAADIINKKSSSSQ